MKDNKGITLVALIITVVIMLILAMVAIGSVTGNGLFSKTRDAVGAYENASRTEAEQIQTLMNEINDYLTGGNAGEDTEGVDPETVAKIGNFVNYSVEVDGVIYDKWRILDLDNNGHIEIVCYSGPDFTLGEKDNATKCKSDYANAIKLLNDASVPYKNGSYGYSTRHLGSDPSNPSSYATISTSYVKFYSGAEIPTATRAYLEQDHHESDLNAIKSFSNTAEGKKLAASFSWLASRYVYAISSSLYFDFRLVGSSGSLSSSDLYCVYSDGRESTFSYSNALAPVVSLESGVKINTSLAGNGSENSPWVLTK